MEVKCIVNKAKLQSSVDCGVHNLKMKRRAGLFLPETELTRERTQSFLQVELGGKFPVPKGPYVASWDNKHGGKRLQGEECWFCNLFFWDDIDLHLRVTEKDGFQCRLTAHWCVTSSMLIPRPKRSLPGRLCSQGILPERSKKTALPTHILGDFSEIIPVRAARRVDSSRGTLQRANDGLGLLGDPFHSPGKTTAMTSTGYMQERLDRHPTRSMFLVVHSIGTNLRYN